MWRAPIAARAALKPWSRVPEKFSQRPNCSRRRGPALSSRKRTSRCRWLHCAKPSAPLPATRSGSSPFRGSAIASWVQSVRWRTRQRTLSQARAHTAGPAVDLCSTARQSQPRLRPGVLGGRHRRGHHLRPVAIAVARRSRPQFVLRLQGHPDKSLRSMVGNSCLEGKKGEGRLGAKRTSRRTTTSPLGHALHCAGWHSPVLALPTPRLSPATIAGG